MKTLKQPWFDEEIARAKRIPKLPDVIEAPAVAGILNRTMNLKHWTIIATLCATALRVDELVHLQVGDIDSAQMIIHVTFRPLRLFTGRHRFITLRRLSCLPAFRAPAVYLPGS